MKVLVINCGSSSIKYQLYEMPAKTVLAKGIVDSLGQEHAKLKHKANGESYEESMPVADHKAGIKIILDTLTSADRGVMGSVEEIAAVGHRVVHGGEAYTGSVKIDAHVKEVIEDCIPLGPLHNPANLTGILEVEAAMPGTPMVAVFDTAFHQTMPKHCYLYGLPYELYEKHRIRKYGFHGTSHQYLTHRTAELLGKPVDEVNIITCHMGNGSSMAAVKNGKCYDTTMGLTPLDGLVMGTRCGTIDPAIVPTMIEWGIVKDHKEADELMNKKSGVLGISQISSDMRKLEEAAEGEGPVAERALLTLSMYAHRIKHFIGAYMALLGRTDAIVFAGGVGENGPISRTEILENLEPMGIIIDDDRNEEMIRGKEGLISTDDSPIKVMVVPTDEEGWIATETYHVCTES